MTSASRLFLNAKPYLPRSLSLLAALCSWLLCYLMDRWGYPEASPYFALLAACFFLYGGNLGSRERHRQWGYVLLALLLSAVAIGLVVWMRRHFDLFLRDYALLLSWLEASFQIPLPQSVSFALPWLNLGLLLAMGVAKLLLVGAMRGIQLLLGVDAGKTLSTKSYGAYEYHADRGWVLIPRWMFVRHFSVALCCLSVLSLFVFWLALEDVWTSTWLPILPAVLLLISGEVAAYLGGKSDSEGEAELGGQDAETSVFANYEAVWKSMRKVWPESWLAAANRDIWGSEQ